MDSKKVVEQFKIIRELEENVTRSLCRFLFFPTMINDVLVERIEHGDGRRWTQLIDLKRLGLKDTNVAAYRKFLPEIRKELSAAEHEFDEVSVAYVAMINECRPDEGNLTGRVGECQNRIYKIISRLGLRFSLIKEIVTKARSQFVVPIAAISDLTTKVRDQTIVDYKSIQDLPDELLPDKVESAADMQLLLDDFEKIEDGLERVVGMPKYEFLNSFKDVKRMLKERQKKCRLVCAENLRLVFDVVNAVSMKFFHKNLEWDDKLKCPRTESAKYDEAARLNPLDAYQAGVVELMRAIDNFDSTNGNTFSTYAYPCIKEAVLNAYYQWQSQRSGVPIDTIKQVYKMVRLEEELSQRLGRDPNNNEIAEDMDVPLEKILLYKKLLNGRMNELSLSAPIGLQVEDGDRFEDRVSDPTQMTPAEKVEDRDDSLEDGFLPWATHRLIKFGDKDFVDWFFSGDRGDEASDEGVDFEDIPLVECFSKYLGWSQDHSEAAVSQLLSKVQMRLKKESAELDGLKGHFQAAHIEQLQVNSRKHVRLDENLWNYATRSFPMTLYLSSNSRGHGVQVGSWKDVYLNLCRYISQHQAEKLYESVKEGLLANMSLFPSDGSSELNCGKFGSVYVEGNFGIDAIMALVRQIQLPQASALVFSVGTDARKIYNSLG